MTHSANIKNLSIALGALSRWPSQPERREEIENLLDKELSLMREEHQDRIQADSKDEIPF